MNPAAAAGKSAPLAAVEPGWSRPPGPTPGGDGRCHRGLPGPRFAAAARNRGPYSCRSRASRPGSGGAPRVTPEAATQPPRTCF
jgi:hypothetical protein